jgi:hypothetical protein
MASFTFAGSSWAYIHRFFASMATSQNSYDAGRGLTRKRMLWRRRQRCVTAIASSPIYTRSASRPRSKAPLFAVHCITSIRRRIRSRTLRAVRSTFSGMSCWWHLSSNRSCPLWGALAASCGYHRELGATCHPVRHTLAIAGYASMAESTMCLCSQHPVRSFLSHPPRDVEAA